MASREITYTEAAREALTTAMEEDMHHLRHRLLMCFLCLWLLHILRHYPLLCCEHQ